MNGIEWFSDLQAEVDRAQQRYADLLAERDRLRAGVKHAIETLSESAPDAPGVLATVALMQLALDGQMQLDVSPETGDGDEASNTTPAMMAMQYRAIAQLDESPDMGDVS
jgi:citrate synthase